MEINYSHGRLSSAQQSICPTVKSETREDQQISNYPPRDSTINKNVLLAINSLLNWKNSQKEGCTGGCNLACMWCQTQNSSSEPVRSVVDRTDRCDCLFALLFFSLIDLFFIFWDVSPHAAQSFYWPSTHVKHYTVAFLPCRLSRSRHRFR